jgi:hypothetical protein
MLKVVTASGKVLYEGHDEVAADRAANEALPQATAIWSLVGAKVDYMHLNKEQVSLVAVLAAHREQLPEQVVRHAKTCTHCQLALFKLS